MRYENNRPSKQERKLLKQSRSNRQNARGRVWQAPQETKNSQENRV